MWARLARRGARIAAWRPRATRPETAAAGADDRSAPIDEAQPPDPDQAPGLVGQSADPEEPATAEVGPADADAAAETSATEGGSIPPGDAGVGSAPTGGAADDPNAGAAPPAGAAEDASAPPIPAGGDTSPAASILGRAVQQAATARARAARQVDRQATALRKARQRGAAELANAAGMPARWRDAHQGRAEARVAAELEARRLATIREEAERRAAEREASEREAVRLEEARQRRIARLMAKDHTRRTRRRRLLLGALVLVLLTAAGAAIAAYYVDSIPTPAQLTLPESTTIYFSDGTTVMAKLGTENRTILAYDEINDVVKQAIVAAEDRSFWTNRGVDLSGVVRAAWNNFRGGPTQGGSTITQQYARIAADLQGLTYARKAREAMLAWKMGKKYSKEEILEFYLNTVPFGRGAYGIEAAAQAYFGKTARRSAPVADKLTVADAMMLAGLVKQPEPDPTNPVDHPGYDPARGGLAAANAVNRWEYVRDGMVGLGYLTPAAAAALEFPHNVRSLDASASPDDLERPVGLVVQHVLSELRQSPPFAGQASDYIRNGGFHIVTTVDKRAQDAAESAADVRRPTAPAEVRGQPADWQAALVAVQPGTGRVLAYYGGNSGIGADFAGWYYDDAGQATGFGQHPPGSSFKVYDLAEALRQHYSLFSSWDSPAVKEFPASGRTKGSTAGPVRNSSSAKCQPHCMLWQAAVASLNVPFFDLTEKLGAGNVIDMAHRAGIDAMWTDLGGSATPRRVDLDGRFGKDLVVRSAAAGAAGMFSTEVGIGQYGVTVLDHANGMATFAAGGKRAQAHFVREVTKDGVRVYAEPLVQTGIGLTDEQVNQLTWTLSQVPAAKLGNGWDAAGKTGTWEVSRNSPANAHTWMVGYTTQLAVAVWLGTTDGKALITTDGSRNVIGATHAGAIWRQFMMDATLALSFDPINRVFQLPKLPASAAPTPVPSPSR
jgi:membrane peptidoglycan carboxypeptidase